MRPQLAQSRRKPLGVGGLRETGNSPHAALHGPDRPVSSVHRVSSDRSANSGRVVARIRVAASPSQSRLKCVWRSRGLLVRPEPCPAGRQHHRTLLRSWRELQRKVPAARQGDPASNRAGGSITTRYSDPMLRPANTRRQTEIPLEARHEVSPMPARQPARGALLRRVPRGHSMQSLTSPACRLKDRGDSIRRAFKNEEAHATWRA